MAGPCRIGGIGLGRVSGGHGPHNLPVGAETDAAPGAVCRPRGQAARVVSLGFEAQPQSDLGQVTDLLLSLWVSVSLEFIHSFNKYMSSASLVPGADLGAGDTNSKTIKAPAHMEHTVQWEETVSDT